jgi:hypothetical protein
MLPELKGKGLFVFSDPGGAKPILSFINFSSKLQSVVAVSDRQYDFFKYFNIPIATCKTGQEEAFIRKHCPDFIFTGTSYTSKIELRFIQAAKKCGVATYSFVDHYTSYSERFTINGDLLYPDYICLPDERALQIARAHNYKSKLIITENYYHRFLKMWTPQFQKAFFWEQLKIPTAHDIIVYAPDPLTNVGGTDKFGLDEFSVLRNILNVLKRMNRKNISLVIKEHPNQRRNLLEMIRIEGEGVNIVEDSLGDINSLLHYADVVVGIFSNILIEAQLLNTFVIRSLIGLSQPDPFAELEIGHVAYSEQELESFIKQGLEYQHE